MTVTVTTTAGTTVRLEEQQLQELRQAVRGTVLMPGDPGYELTRTVFNVMHDRRPAVVVRCTGTADVVAAVQFARAHELLVAVRGGGHSVAGHSLCDGGLLVDLSAMRGVEVDPSHRTARVQAGATWGDVDHETQLFGLVAPGGVMSETGVAGLTLGGGYGWVRRKYGLSIDSLRSITVVCADGTVRTASVESEPDLFWAMRGGGGNFGIATAFEFDLHALGPTVAFAGVLYSVTDLEAVLRGWRDVTAGVGDEVTSVVVTLTFPAHEAVPPEAHNTACAVVAAVYVGDVDEGMAALAPFRKLATPVADISQPMPFNTVQSAFDWLTPPGVHRAYWKSQYLPALSDEVIAVLAAHAQTRPGDTMLVNVFHMGGAIAEVAPDATAFSERAWPYMVSIDGMWPDSDDDADRIAWVRRVWDDVATFGTGTTYTNFTGQFDETPSESADSALGENLARLRALKRRYDPTNFFRLNANIEPA